MVMSYSSTFEYFSSSFLHLCISEKKEKKKKKKKKKKSLKTQSNDHRVVTRGQKLCALFSFTHKFQNPLFISYIIPSKKKYDKYFLDN